ncbi:YlcI/YnfO family protein [[Eubacterium] hominis]|uniref:YlcI/YnfO family protein n=1 Tax=[Eubacterium] hominis TaxID=2764325 RepID=UPI003A4E06D8
MAFQLKPNKKETENKTIRFPISLIDDIEKAIENQDVTFSRFVIQACEYALENLETNGDNSNEDNV